MAIEKTEVRTQSGITLIIETVRAGGGSTVSIIKAGANKTPFILHWGMSERPNSPWKIPPEASWPKGTKLAGAAALQTQFTETAKGDAIEIFADDSLGCSALNFVLYSPITNTWDNNRGNNYTVKLPAAERLSPAEALREFTTGAEKLFEDSFEIDGGFQLAVALTKESDQFKVCLVTDMQGPLVMHWGVASKSAYQWTLPPDNIRPADSKIYDLGAQNTFIPHGSFNRMRLTFKETDAPYGIPFLLRQTDTGNWIKNKGQNFYIPVRKTGQSDYPLEDPSIALVADEIIESETGRNSWTLMHRFNLCHDLLGKIRLTNDSLSLIYVWLRYSAIRQLDWQRRYNTKPRELSHAMDRLTLRVAEIYSSVPECREIARLIAASLGRGGEGQRIRDEILNIMHRHHIKEVAGHFLEEWHQKLHNNTTPDDVAICSAYIEFLKSNGNKDVFYNALQSSGVDRERLRGFERPILSDPDFIPHLKDALLHDFEEYLKIMKSVHSGTDLETSAGAARYMLDPSMYAEIDDLLANSGRMDAIDAAEKITHLRRGVKAMLDVERDTRRARDLLLLDLGLEEFYRTTIEAKIGAGIAEDRIPDLMALTTQNILFSHGDPEFSSPLSQMQRLLKSERFTADWSLHMKSIADRLSRAIGSFIDGYYKTLKPKADFLGNAFFVENWAVSLFTEEVVRGRPTFLLSHFIRRLEPILRRHAKLGDWQVISRGHGRGMLDVVPSLRDVQGRRFEGPTILIADKVHGDEEPPEGVTAIITPEPPDIVSHVAVRTRNANILFAACLDSGRLAELKTKRGSSVTLKVTAGGDVDIQEGAYGPLEIEAAAAGKPEIIISKPPLTDSYAIAQSEFDAAILGRKSTVLSSLTGRVPDWIGIPASAAIPFGVCERVMGKDENFIIKQSIQSLMSRIDEDAPRVLKELRGAVEKLTAPSQMKSSLAAAMRDSGLRPPDDWGEAWSCIKRVWASKWNERAYYSRKSRGIPHDSIYMAVLIQETVPADYSFVIHTANPISGRNDELYAEVVPGLAETLVGNYPGRALGFTALKSDMRPSIISYPSKSRALYGGGLIFRSDSNAEDLASYAGAGLYDSVMIDPPQDKTLDYTESPLVWQPEFRDNLLKKIAEIGIIIENLMASPQDIEGAYAGGRFYVVQARPQAGAADVK